MQLSRSAVLVLALGIGVALNAGDDKHKEGDKAKAVTGCLSMDKETSQYVLTEEGTGKKINIAVSGSSVNLAKHTNHKVKLSGTWAGQDMSQLTVTKLQHISDTCTAAP